MFVNTGNMSFWLGIFFLLISLLGIFFAFLVANKKLVDHESLEKIIDLGKWFIVSVAITLSASIINDGFKERDQDIKEMQVFDKYTTVILEADGVNKRKLLSEYFSTVSPSGSIKDSWKEYKTIVDGQASELKEAQEKSLEIAVKADKGNASDAELAERAHLDEMVASLNKSLTSNKSSLKPRVYFHIKEESQRAKAEQLAKDVAMLANIVVPGVQHVNYPASTNQLRYFRAIEEQEVRHISEVLASLGFKSEVTYISGFESSTKIRPKHYELWISESGL
jgi:cbb3-type cytochrome oxidase subunit 3